MRRRARTDTNQAAIVDALRRTGASVVCLHAVGGGCPDLLVGFRNRTLLLEVKDGSRAPSERCLTPKQVRFTQTWRGHQAVVESVDEALAVLLNATG